VVKQCEVHDDGVTMEMFKCLDLRIEEREKQKAQDKGEI
jgi:hypothetical protein